MSFFSPVTRNRVSNFITFLPLFVVLIVSTSALAQQRVSRQFPAGKNVRLELKNLSGTITVESWARDEIKITATMEAPAVHFNPRQTDAGLIIDIVADNRDRGDVGGVNFKVQVPNRSSLDLETRSGQITVSNVRSEEHTSELQSRVDLVC